jgi:hypothetical protein
MTNKRFRQRSVYLVTAALVACLVGGFALAASFSIGGQNTAYQGSQTTTVSAIAGLQYSSTNLFELGASVVNSACTVATPCDMTAGSTVDCVAGFSPTTSCVATDFVEVVNLTTLPPTQFPGASHEVRLMLFVTGTPAGGSSQVTVVSGSFYYTEPAAPATAYTITLDFDVGSISSGPGTVNTVTVIGNSL